MPSNIDNQIVQALREFVEANKGMMGREGVATMSEQFRVMLERNVSVMDQLHEKGELTEKGFAKLEKQIEKTNKALKGTAPIMIKFWDRDMKKAGTAHLKAMQEVTKATEQWTAGLKSSIKTLVSQVPLIGSRLTKGVDGLFKGINKRIASIGMTMFGSRGGGGLGGLSVGKLGIAGAVVGGIGGLLKLFEIADRRMADMVKSTGYMRSRLRPLRDEMNKITRSMTQAGIYSEQLSEVASALVVEFGSLSGITGKLIESTALMAKAYQLSAQEAAGLVDILTRGLGMTNKEMDRFVDMVDVNARNAGVAVSLVMRDIARDANFIAQYSTGFGENIAEAAIHARRMGSSLSAMQATSEAFLDFETAITSTMEINQILGTQINAQHAHRLAMTGDMVGLEKYVLGAIADESDRLEHNVLIRQRISQLTGKSTEDLMKSIRLQKMSAFELKKYNLEAENQRKLAMEMQTFMEKAKNIFFAEMLEPLNKMGTWLEKRINPWLEGLVTMLNEGTLGTAIWNKLVDAGVALGKGIRSGIFSNPFGVDRNEPDPELAKHFGVQKNMARGGLVTKPTRALIGEAGPELVLPLNGRSMDTSGGMLKFARGGAIIPLGAGSGMANIGALTAAGDPTSRRERSQAVRLAAEEYRSVIRGEQRKLWQREQELLDRQERATNTFFSGVMSFGKASSRMARAYGLGGPADMIKNAILNMLPEGWRGAAGGAANIAMEGYGAYQQGGFGGLAKFAGGKLLQSDRYLDFAGGLSDKLGGKFGGNVGDAAHSFMTGDWKGGLGSLGKTGLGKMFKGAKSKLLGSALGKIGMSAIPGIGQALGIANLLGIDVGGIAMGALKKIPGLGGAIGGITKMFGFGKGAKIESAWHPKLLEVLYSQGAKPGDKIPKDQIKKLNMQIFGSEKAPGTKDGFSFYDMKGDEEKADRARSPGESIALSYQIAQAGGGKVRNTLMGVSSMLGFGPGGGVAPGGGSRPPGAPTASQSISSTLASGAGVSGPGFRGGGGGFNTSAGGVGFRASVPINIQIDGKTLASVVADQQFDQAVR